MGDINVDQTYSRLASRRGSKLMDLSVVREQFAQQAVTIGDVLNRHLQNRGCPCDWPQFEYWVSKPQGPGWQDNIQNELVRIALKLPCFHRSPSTSGEYGVESDITCSNCGRQWLYFNEEWRMLAYHLRLVPEKPSPAATVFDGAVGGSVFATAGLEPRNLRALSLEDWAEFMLGEPCAPTEFVISTPRHSLGKRFIAWLRRHV